MGHVNEQDDKYFYYQELCTNGEKTVLFETVTIPGAEWGNDTAGQSFSIGLQAEAIQADYFTPETEGDTIINWGGVEVESQQ